MHACVLRCVYTDTYIIQKQKRAYMHTLRICISHIYIHIYVCMLLRNSPYLFWTTIHRSRPLWLECPQVLALQTCMYSMYVCCSAGMCACMLMFAWKNRSIHCHFVCMYICMYVCMYVSMSDLAALSSWACLPCVSCACVRKYEPHIRALMYQTIQVHTSLFQKV